MDRKKDLDTKERNKIHKANKFYDKYMAGKWNRKEGEYNFDLSKSKKKKTTDVLSSISCKHCGISVIVHSNTHSFICSKCSSFNSVG